MMKKYFVCRAILLAMVFSLLGSTGCSSKKDINFKIHTEPEGAHVVYRQGNDSWIYLGATPLEVVEVMSEEQVKRSKKISLKAMRCGYLDQTKEWSADSLINEIEDQGVIFWTPRLIKNNE